MLKDKKLFLFDIDGTIALGNELYDGTRDLLNHIKNIGGRALYITNNSTKSRKSYVEKFAKWEIETDEEDFVTSSYASCLYVKEKYKDGKVFVVGTSSFVKELKSFGINVTESIENDIVCVLIGFDDEFTYEKSMKACELLQTGDVDFLATNPDLRCPYTFGFIPDCGAICKMISVTVGREPEFIGKPERRIAELCLDLTGFTADESIVVGDRLYTDILCGVNAGIDTCLLLTGEATRADVEKSPYKPDYIFENVRELYCHCI